MSTTLTQGRDTKRRKRPRSAQNAESHKLAVHNAELQHQLRESERQNRKLQAQINRLRVEQHCAIFGGFYGAFQWVQ